jgi:hypothetical protein
MEHVTFDAPDFVAVITAEASASRPPIEIVGVAVFVRSSVDDCPRSEAVTKSGVVGATGARRSIVVERPSYEPKMVWL